MKRILFSLLFLIPVLVFGQAKKAIPLDGGYINNLTVQSRVFYPNGLWDDLRFPSSSLRLPGSSAPTPTAYKGGQVLSFVDNSDNVVYFLVQFPHAWMQGDSIEAHVHYAVPTAGAGSGAEYVRWDMTYSWANIGGTFGSETTISDSVDLQNTAQDYHGLLDLGMISGSGKTLSSMMVCSLKRNTSVTDNSGNDIYLLEIDFHIRKDAMGSRGEVIK